MKLHIFSKSRPTSIDSKTIFSFIVAVEEITMIVSYILDKLDDFNDWKELSHQLGPIVKQISTSFSGIGPGIDLADQVAQLNNLQEYLLGKECNLW